MNNKTKSTFKDQNGNEEMLPLNRATSGFAAEEDDDISVNKPLWKSTFVAYEKPPFDNDEEGEEESSKNKQTDKQKRCQTDGFFQNKKGEADSNEKKNKPKKKKHIFARRATYLPKADKRRLTLKIVDTYRDYPSHYQDLGYGVIFNIFSWISNLYMHIFSRLMSYMGKILTSLEVKYTSENVGYGMQILSNTIYLVPTLFIKCNPQIDFSLAILIRGIITCAIISQMAAVKGVSLTDFNSYDYKRLLYRGVTTAVSQMYFFFALGKLPLSINMVISNTGPILVFIMSVLFFDGHMRINDVIGIFIAVGGVYCVSNNKTVTAFFSGKEIPAALVQSKYVYAEGSERLILIIFFVTVYVGWAYGVLIVKQLQKADTLVMNFFVAMFFVISGSIACFIRPETIYDLSWKDCLGLLVFVGLFSFASQYTFITSTFLNHKHGPLTMLGYLSVIKSYIIQVIFFHEIPSAAEIVGSLLVLLGVAKIVIH